MSKSITLSSEWASNSLIWISSLKPDEQGPTRRIVEDLGPFIASQDLIFQYHHVETKSELIDVLNSVISDSKHGMKPVIHFDMHGSKLDGLILSGSGETVTWKELYQILQAINVNCGNNLLVVAGVCYGMHVLFELDINSPCAAYAIIAPEQTVSFGFLEDNTVKFYREIFSGSELFTAFKTSLESQMSIYHSERMLFILLARYIKEHCIGAGKSIRTERLVTAAFEDGRPKNRHTLRATRKHFKTSIKPTQNLINRYANTYLIGKRSNIKLDDILALIKSEA